jgi:hypothetical protein
VAESAVQTHELTIASSLIPTSFPGKATYTTPSRLRVLFQVP